MEHLHKKGIICPELYFRLIIITNLQDWNTCERTFKLFEVSLASRDSTVKIS